MVCHKTQSSFLSLKEFKEHEIQTQVMEASIIILLSHAEVPSFLSLLQVISDPTQASRIRNKGSSAV